MPGLPLQQLAEPPGQPPESNPNANGGSTSPKRFSLLMLVALCPPIAAEFLALMQGVAAGQYLLVGASISAAVVVAVIEASREGHVSKVQAGAVVAMALIIVAVLAIAPTAWFPFADGGTRKTSPTPGTSSPTDPADADQAPADATQENPIDTGMEEAPAETPAPAVEPAPSPQDSEPQADPTPNPTLGAPTPAATQVQCAPVSGTLSMTAAPYAVTGGPNVVPIGCAGATLRLTAVEVVTWARACLADGSGSCGDWVRLVDGGAVNRLSDGMPSGTQWNLDVKAESGETINFVLYE